MGKDFLIDLFEFFKFNRTFDINRLKYINTNQLEKKNFKFDS